MVMEQHLLFVPGPRPGLLNFSNCYEGCWLILEITVFPIRNQLQRDKITPVIDIRIYLHLDMLVNM